MKNLKSAKELLIAYSNGERNFIECDFDGCSLQAADLSGIKFFKCFMSFDFRDANLTDVHFEKCNLKSADFSNANLKNVVITGCSVDGTDFKTANIENLKFEKNYSMGVLLEQSDLRYFC